MSYVDGYKFQMKQDDLRPYLQVQIFNPDGTPMDLTGDTVMFHMRKSGQAAKVSALANILDPTQGKVEYQWSGTDTSEVGEFRAEFEVNGNDTYPKETYITVSILPDLN